MRNDIGFSAEKVITNEDMHGKEMAGYWGLVDRWSAQVCHERATAQDRGQLFVY